MSGSVVVLSQVLPVAAATPAAAHAAAAARGADHGPLETAAAAPSRQVRRLPRLFPGKCSPALPWQLQQQQQLGHRHQRQERHHLIETHRIRL